MRKLIDRHSKGKLIIAAAIMGLIIYLVLYNPRDNTFYVESEIEVALARKICENSVQWIENNMDRLKLDNNDLRHIPVQGRQVILKHVKYPKIIFLHTGYKHSNANNELYCSFKDPRNASIHYFFDYGTQGWVERTRTKR